jgi:hypothetical protein
MFATQARSRDGSRFPAGFVAHVFAQSHVHASASTSGLNVRANLAEPFIPSALESMFLAVVGEQMQRVYHSTIADLNGKVRVSSSAYDPHATLKRSIACGTGSTRTASTPKRSSA